MSNLAPTDTESPAEAPPDTSGSLMGDAVNMSVQNITEAGSFAKERAEELKNSVLEGNWSLRILVLLGALAMIITSVVGLLTDLYRIEAIGAIMDIYCILLGVTMILLEYGHQLSFFASIQPTLYKNFLFLKFVWGRGFFYFFAGTLKISQRYSMMNIIVGCCVCVLGLLLIYVGRSAASKLSDARRSQFSPEALENKFQETDIELKGSLDRDQFSILLGFVGMDLNRREVDAVFLQLDDETSGRVSFQAFLNWFNTEATENFSVVAATGEYTHMPA
jgi:hypothetical protein